MKILFKIIMLKFINFGVRLIPLGALAQKCLPLRVLMSCSARNDCAITCYLGFWYCR